jgi:acyl carrier protein
MNCTTHQIESMLLAEIADVCPELGAQLHADASLTGELGLDSLCLTSLFGMVKREIGQVELSCWFIRASNTGTDTIASLAHYLVAQVSQRRAA